MTEPEPLPDQLEGDLHSVTDDEYFEHLDQAKQIPIYDADGNEVDVFADVVDARQQKADADAEGRTWAPDDFLPGSAP